MPTLPPPTLSVMGFRKGSTKYCLIPLQLSFLKVIVGRRFTGGAWRDLVPRSLPGTWCKAYNVLERSARTAGLGAESNSA